MSLPKDVLLPIDFYKIEDSFVKNSTYNPVKNTFYSVFKFDKTIYKSSSGENLVDYIDSKDYSTIVSFLDLNKIVKLDSCFAVINNTYKKDFNPKELPKWLLEKNKQD